MQTLQAITVLYKNNLLFQRLNTNQNGKMTISSIKSFCNKIHNEMHFGDKTFKRSLDNNLINPDIYFNILSV